MSTRFSRQDESRRIFFRVERNGILVPGLAASDFTATVVNPSDTSSTIPTVVESTTKGGLYYIDVPSAFFTERGEYGVAIEVNTTGGPAIRTTMALPLYVTQEDIDTIADGNTGTFNRASDSLADLVDGVWDELLSGHVIVGTAGKVVADILRMLENRLEVDIPSQQLILYADDGTTPLRRWPIETTGGEVVTTVVGVQTKRKVSTI